ncbi:helix-turn-helix domain-containing protein [Paramagnetospirillum marisnigri]|uniref:helix-turn-helix domain-containing protein n=1 Tax=Paramagnetospirillum marisnigri TaxID=1285242 RepID=UPI0012E72D13|nr:helix-turn-helix domain-containing protein [Paramagnetospirillum marisnigri]
MLWVPVLLVVISLVAVASGILRLMGRALSALVEALVAGWRSLAAAASKIADMGRRLVAPIFAFTPATTVRDRPSDGRFNAVEDKVVRHIEPATPDDLALIRRALAEVPDKGDNALPQDLALLARLLADSPPGNDFAAADMVRDCFDEFGSSGVRSRALLAVAQKLARHFATPARLPLATTRAWRMLDPVVFGDEMAAQLSVIGRFVFDWQKTQQTFLCLEYGEIELIETLFEAMHPGRHAKEMADVLEFKVLSNRRQGLLRRVPHRVRKLAQDPARRADARDYVEASQAFLNKIATARQYQPIIDAAAASLEEINKLAEKMFPPAAQALPPPGAGGGEGQALARINPIKMPASELAERAIREAQANGGTPQSVPSGSPAPIPATVPTAAQPARDADVIPRTIPATPPSAAPIPTLPPQSLPAQALPAQAPLRATAPTSAPPRRAPGLGPRYSADARPLRLKPPLAVVARHEEPPPSLSARPTAILPGGRPQLPAFLSAPLPVLANALLTASPGTPEPVKPKVATPLTGRIALPSVGGKPVAVSNAAPVAQRPAQPTAPTAAPARVATGTIALPPAMAKAPAPAQATVAATATDAPKATVTDLTVVPKSKRPPITQAIKRQSVLKVLRGESSAAIAAALGIREGKLDEWVDAFISAGAGALSPAKPKREHRRKPAEEPLSAEVLRAKLAEVLATAQMIERAMESQLSPRRPMLLPPPDSDGGHHLPKRPRRKG